MSSYKFLGPKGKTMDYSLKNEQVEGSATIYKEPATVFKDDVDLVEPLEAKGKIKIELTDAESGELVDVVESNNFISKGVEALYQIQMKNLFQRRMSSINSRGERPDSVIDPFRYMYLTSADHEADPDNEWLIKGEVLGEARTYTSALGSNPDTAGALNMSESYVSDNLVRIVVDFPSNAANGGDINSVYFAAGDQVITDSFVRSDIYTYNVGIEKYRDRYYVLVKGEPSRHDGAYTHSLDVLDENFNLIESFETASWPYIANFTIYDDHIYCKPFTNSSLNDGHLFKVPLNDIEGFYENRMDYKHVDRLDLAVAYAGITYMPDKQQFALYNTNGNIAIFDTDFNLLDTYKTDVNMRYNDGSGYNSANLNLPYADGLLLWRDFSIDVTNKRMIPRGNTCRLGGVSENALFLNGGHHQPKIGFSSRAKLSSPVRKTTTNLMKVTYDFVLPSTFPELQ